MNETKSSPSSAPEEGRAVPYYAHVETTGVGPLPAPAAGAAPPPTQCPVNAWCERPPHHLGPCDYMALPSEGVAVAVPLSGGEECGLETGCQAASLRAALSDAERRAGEAERWQVEVAEGLGYLNRAEGQDGYEVAEPSVIIAAFKAAESALASLQHDLDVMAESLGVAGYERPQEIITAVQCERAALAAEREGRRGAEQERDVLRSRVEDLAVQAERQSKMNPPELGDPIAVAGPWAWKRMAELARHAIAVASRRALSPASTPGGEG